MNRRTFLYSMLGSAVATSSANLAQDAKIKIAFLGGSHSHAKDKVKVVQESPLYELVGLFEEDPQLREYYQRSGVTLLSRDQILNEKSIQVVAVESAVKDHSPHARLVLQAGKHVHVEKPPSDDLNAFKSLVSRSREETVADASRLHVALQPWDQSSVGSRPRRLAGQGLSVARHDEHLD